MTRFALLLLLAAPMVAPADCLHNWMNCPADSSLQINSFTIRASYVIQSITAARGDAARGLTSHHLTVAQAKAALAKTDKARALWNQAVAVCKANAEGVCTENEAKAYTLLKQAEEVAR